MSALERPGGPSGRSRGRRRWPIVVLVVVVVLALLVAGLLAVRRAGRHRDDALTATAAYRTVSLTAQGSGTVVDSRTVAVGTDGTWTATAEDGAATGAAGQGPAVTVESVDAGTGDAVSSGERLATVKTATGATIDVDAPASGTVRSVQAVTGERTGAALFIIGEGPTRVSVPISEYDVTSLRDGQHVALAYAGIMAGGSGTVERIGTTPSAPAGSGASGSSGGSQASSVTDYPVIVSLDSPSSQVRTGMDVQVTITERSVDHALAVPVQALHPGASGTSRVTLLQGRRQVSRTVRVGLVGDTEAQVVSGLRSGDAVVTGAPAAGATTGGAGGTGHGGLLSGLR